jgi:hypothetical protein
MYIEQTHARANGSSVHIGGLVAKQHGVPLFGSIQVSTTLVSDHIIAMWCAHW